MANTIQKFKLSPSGDISFNKLVPSQSNVRREKAGVSIGQLAMRDWLCAYGLFGQIIWLKLRFFVPVDATGPAILSKILECYPIACVADRAAS
jgi:hypothetical protein